ncbi:MAG: VWA domain-containing protein [Acidobacteria bacterium]|nr:VWA domain-containing protein [Acidobacteriota bacterium]
MLLAFVASTAAQQTSTISVDVKVVNVVATVRDKHGNIINSLTKDDFVLDEDGRPQNIRYFTRESDLPLSLGLLVDTSLSQLQVLDQEKRASASFTNDVLREGKDTAFLIHFDREVELLQDLTTSRQKIASALDQLQAPRYEDARNTGNTGDDRTGHGRRGGGFGSGTLLYDSIFLACDEVLQKPTGRKAIIVLTDGVDHGSKMSLERAIESAQRADTMVYSIYFEGHEGGDRGGTGGGGPWGGRRRGGGWPGGGGGWPGGGGGYPGGGGGYPGGRTDPRSPRVSSEDGKKILQRLSNETGGRMFAVSKKEPVGDIYKKIEDELRNQYNIGYTPDRPADAAPDYRHIHVATKQKDLIVQAREGYYASRQVDAKQGN